MASKYYNPRLAASLGAAYTEPYISASEGVERGVRRYERMRAIDIKARAAKAAEWQKQYSQSMDDWIKYNDKISQAPNELAKLPDSLQQYYMERFQVARQEYQKFANPNVSNMQRSLAFNEIQSNLNNHIANIKSTPEKFASFNPETISVANDPVAIKAARAEINGEFKVEADGTVVFNDDSIESKPVDKLFDFDFIPVATETFGKKVTQMDSILERLAKNGIDENLLDGQLDRELGDLNLTREESISVAFDYLGKEQPGFINLTKEGKPIVDINEYGADAERWATDTVPDENSDGYIDAGELNKWIKGQLKESAKNAYPSYKDRFDKTDATPNAEEKKTEKINTYYKDGKRFLNDLMNNFNPEELKSLKFIGKEIADAKLVQDKIVLTTIEGRQGDEQFTKDYEFDINNTGDLKKLINLYLNSTYGTTELIDDVILKVKNAEDKEFKTGLQRFREIVGEPIDVFNTEEESEKFD